MIEYCLTDKDSAVQLHGAKLLEELGSMILQHTQDTASANPATTPQPPRMEVQSVRIENIEAAKIMPQN